MSISKQWMVYCHNQTDCYGRDRVWYLGVSKDEALEEARKAAENNPYHQFSVYELIGVSGCRKSYYEEAK